jgi:hypothetical protein
MDLAHAVIGGVLGGALGYVVAATLFDEDLREKDEELKKLKKENRNYRGF